MKLYMYRAKWGSSHKFKSSIFYNQNIHELRHLGCINNELRYTCARIYVIAQFDIAPLLFCLNTLQIHINDGSGHFDFIVFENIPSKNKPRSLLYA